MLGFVSKKWIKQIKDPSNYIPYYDERVTGLNKLQNKFSEVLATINKEIPDPRPYPCLSIESKRITITPENKSWEIIRIILIIPIWEGGPYAPYQTWPAASPKHKIRANVF